MRRPARRAAWFAAATCLLAAIFVLLDPLVSATAVARLLNPFGDAAWPRKNHLTISEPVGKVARGGAFEVQVRDAAGAALPQELRVFYRFDSPGGAATEESAVVRASGSAAIVRRENVLRPFAYRIEGGDDHSMNWMDADVVEPPAVESLAAKLFPPSYTGWLVEKAEGNIRALVGTRIEIEAKATKPLKSATLVLEGGPEFPGRLSDDGLRITFDDPALLVTASGGYRIELIDREGMSGGGDAPWEICAVPDSPPSVIIEQPAANIYVTPVAAVPLRVLAKDDLAVQRIVLKYHAASSASDGSAPNADQAPPADAALELYSGPEKMLPQPQGGLAGGARGAEETAEYRWELEPLKLAPGMQMEFFAEASDYLPQAGRSDVRRLFVVTARDLQDRLAARQNVLAAELLRALTMQQAGREQIEALRIRLEELKRFEQPDLDRLRAAELNQRQVHKLLTSTGEGVPMHVLAILADLENNRLETPDVVERMQTILAELDRVGREHLPEIGRELNAAIKTAAISLSGSQDKPAENWEGEAPAEPRGKRQETAPASARQEPRPPEQEPRPSEMELEHLDLAAKQQEQVVAALERLLAQLKQAEGYQRFHRDLSLLLRDQEETAKRSVEVGRRTLTKSLVDLPPPDVADLRILAARELEHARTLDRILQSMQDASEQLRKDDPVAADTVADALDAAVRLAIGSTMRVVRREPAAESDRPGGGRAEGDHRASSGSARYSRQSPRSGIGSFGEEAAGSGRRY